MKKKNLEVTPRLSLKSLGGASHSCRCFAGQEHSHTHRLAWDVSRVVWPGDGWRGRLEVRNKKKEDENRELRMANGQMTRSNRTASAIASQTNFNWSNNYWRSLPRDQDTSPLSL